MGMPERTLSVFPFMTPQPIRLRVFFGSILRIVNQKLSSVNERLVLGMIRLLFLTDESDDPVVACR